MKAQIKNFLKKIFALPYLNENELRNLDDSSSNQDSGGKNLAGSLKSSLSLQETAGLKSKQS